jgi:CheY-like chemotaxis protein
VPLVLAIEPDLRQAAIVKRIVRENGLADVAVVDSRDAALEAMRTTVPDVLLISALLSPRDEDELVAHLRTLDDADHLQTHTIPQLASALRPGEGRTARGLLSAFRRKKEPEGAPTGCDPDMFAEEIRAYLQRAAEIKRERLNARATGAPQDKTWRSATHSEKTPEPMAGPAAPEAPAAGSSWASPFEWKPSNPSPLVKTAAPANAGPAAGAESLMAHLRPPAGIPVVEDLFAPARTDEPVPAAVPAPRPTAPTRLAEPVPVPEPIRVAEPIHLPEPIRVAEAIPVVEPIRIPEPIVVAEPVQAAAPIPVTAPVQVSRSATKDSGLGIRDLRLAMRDKRLGALATWARSENGGRAAAEGGDDLRGVLAGLSVPSSVVAVGYGRGCRIRRVRVPAAREPHEKEAVGAVILSRRALAEQRALRDQPPA